MIYKIIRHDKESDDITQQPFNSYDEAYDLIEEIYSDVFNENKFLQDNSFPDSSQFTNSKDINNINWMIQVVSDIRKTRSEIGVQPNKTIEIYVTGATLSLIHI